MNKVKTASWLLQGRGHGETHVTLIQQMNGQWADSFPYLSLAKPNQSANANE